MRVTEKSSNLKNTHLESVSRSHTLLQKMSKNWYRRAQVRTQNVEQNLESLFDDAQKDFRVDLLPFKHHPAFLEISAELQNKILSCGWLAYNEKTISIEAKIIAPACYNILYQKLPGVNDAISQEIASETLVDESYHILLSSNASNVTRQHRGLHALTLPEFSLVTNMYREQAQYSENWQKILVGLVTAIVSEVFVSDYLKLLSQDFTIQPFNRVTVHIHRLDEMAHSSIFKHLTKHIYSQLNNEQKQFFSQILPKPVHWFADVELSVWRAILEQIGFPKARQIIADCALANDVNLMCIDYTELITLAEELGILNSSLGVDSFEQYGLLN